jgi:hypothetical protein
MRSGIIGFFLGALLVVLALVVLQQRVIRDFEPDLAFHFGHYVFNVTEISMRVVSSVARCFPHDLRRPFTIPSTRR